MAKGLVRVAAKAPISAIGKFIINRPIQQAIAIGSIEQYNNDLVISYTDDGTEISIPITVNFFWPDL